MAEFGKPGEHETLIPHITQTTLAEMIGTTRSRVSFFMNRFRKLGFIEYNGRIHVHKSLLNVVLARPSAGIQDGKAGHSEDRDPFDRICQTKTARISTTMEKESFDRSDGLL